MSKQSMNTEKLGKLGLYAFRGGMTIGIGALLWLQSNTVSQKEFQDYKASHNRERDLILENINTKFDTIYNELKRMNVKLDRLATYNPPRHEPEVRGKL